MKNKNRLILISIGLLCLSAFSSPVQAAMKERTVLATTFPIYQIVRNVIQDREGIRLELMLSNQMGCPHDYSLTPQDMQKLSKADILVINGLGMEEFLGAPIERANPDIMIIDSSTGIEETIQYDGCCHEHGHEHHAEETEMQTADTENHKDEHHAHCHHHAGPNPHLFASPQMVARLTMNIAAGLSRVDPDGEATYLKNATGYAEKMNQLAHDLETLGVRLKNNRIVQPHGVFDYLARDMNLSIVATMLAHGQEPSAFGLKHLAKTIKEKQVGAIIIEPQYPEKVGRTLSEETGIPVVMIDPVATGPANAPLDYYEKIMRQNMKTFEQTLGLK